ncbi:hypothetical protein MKX01_001903 [Papaver californicum]|nr:hypothetical protein MKX01_001903 [Papaver californicum]
MRISKSWLKKWSVLAEFIYAQGSWELEIGVLNSELARRSYLEVMKLITSPPELSDQEDFVVYFSSNGDRFPNKACYSKYDNESSTYSAPDLDDKLKEISNLATTLSKPWITAAQGKISGSFTFELNLCFIDTFRHSSMPFKN